MFLKKILYYLDIRTLFKPNPAQKNVNVKFMNGMNRLSIFMFLFALVVMLLRYIGK
jgi:hypothetical protein